jgi:protein-tyrosine-phosphatase
VELIELYQCFCDRTRLRILWGFDDPAHAEGSEEEKLAVFRRVRDEIRRVFGAYAAGRRDAARD